MRERLALAKSRLDTLDYYAKPVDTRPVRVRVWPWFFTMFYPQFGGMCLTQWLIVMRRPDFSDELLTHELCHVWQIQNDGYWTTLRAYAKHEYRANPYEIEARRAVLETITRIPGNA